MSRKAWTVIIVVALFFGSFGIRRFVRMRSATATATDDTANGLRQTEKTVKHWGLHTNSTTGATNASPTK